MSKTRDSRVYYKCAAKIQLLAHRERIYDPERKKRHPKGSIRCKVCDHQPWKKDINVIRVSESEDRFGKFRDENAIIAINAK
jgi:hypothetical protein